MYTIVRVWEKPVRLTHWVNVFSIIVLSVTGIYIGAPFMHAVRNDQMIMSNFRMIHFAAGYIFLASFIIRMYWMFAGNQWAGWREFLPITGKQWKDIGNQILYYLYMKKDPPHVVGHASIAALTYLGFFFLMFVEIATGFALYAQGDPDRIAKYAGGWLLGLMGAGLIRLIHHLTMWAILVFATLHFYIAWHNDIFEKASLMSSIFNGYKTVKDEKH
jgi:Ni/Fe-hydrogenase 1 B-type cytochrome subunit